MRSMVGTLPYCIPISMQEETRSRDMELLALEQDLLAKKNLKCLRQEERLGICLRNLPTVSVLLSGANNHFRSHLGCSEQNAIRLSIKGGGGSFLTTGCY